MKDLVGQSERQNAPLRWEEVVVVVAVVALLSAVVATDVESSVGTVAVAIEQ